MKLLFFLSFIAFVLHILVALFLHHIYHFSHISSLPLLPPLVHTPCRVPDGEQIFTVSKKRSWFQWTDFFFSFFFVPFPWLSPPFLSISSSFSASSPVPDGDDAFSASRQHWPSACGLVPVHLLWLLCQPSAARLSVQLPARHWGVSSTHIWWVVLYRTRRKDCFFFFLNHFVYFCLQVKTRNWQNIKYILL